MVVFSDGEVAALAECPDALRLLAGRHDDWACQADSVGCASVSFHEERARVLRAEAARIEESY